MYPFKDKHILLEQQNAAFAKTHSSIMQGTSELAQEMETFKKDLQKQTEEIQHELCKVWAATK